MRRCKHSVHKAPSIPKRCASVRERELTQTCFDVASYGVCAMFSSCCAVVLLDFVANARPPCLPHAFFVTRSKLHKSPTFGIVAIHLVCEPNAARCSLVIVKVELLYTRYGIYCYRCVFN
jgi:hypothetical protein